MGVETIGLIAGQGEFPVLFAEAARSLKTDVFVFGLEGVTDKKVESFAREAYYVGLGALSDLVDALKKTKIRNVVLAGGIPKREIFNPGLHMDDTARGFIAQNGNKGDDHLLRAFRFFLKARCGVNVVDSRRFLKNAMAPKGVLTKRPPTAAEWQDLKFGFKIAKAIGKLDIGQTVVVKNGVVLAVEAIEGTDRAIRRAGEIGRANVVVVKTAKPGQDLRFDLPCVGVGTIDSIKAAGSGVLGVEAGKTILLSGENFIPAADRAGIAVVGL